MFDVKFTIEELLKATGGTLHGPQPQFTEIENIVTDSREVSKNALFIAFSGDNFDAHQFLSQAVKNGAIILCIQEDKVSSCPSGIPAILVPSTLTAFQNIARFHRLRFHDLRMIMLTGSCGKTSTKEAIRAICVQAFGENSVLATEGNTNNQIGVPQNLLRLKPNHKVAVIEAGTNHHGEIAPLSHCAIPDVALIVSIARCHLEFLGSLDGVAEEKSKIFTHLNPASGIAVIPSECPGHDILLDAAKGFHQITFGCTESNDTSSDLSSTYLGGNLHGSSFILKENSTGKSFKVQWHLQGKHNASNAAAAAAAGHAIGISMEDIAHGLSQTTLPGLRSKITEHNGVTWIDDAYNANPDSMIAALHWLKEFVLPKKLYLVLGDMGELGENTVELHANVCKVAREFFPDAHYIFVGEKMKKAAQMTGLKGLSFSDSENAANSFPDIPQGYLVFLKASRSTRLERIEQKVFS